jgi:archaellum component FlaC
MRHVVTGMLVGVALFAGAARAEDSQISAAQEKVRAARDELKAIKGDYDGHRARAVNHLDQALEELRDAQKVDTRHDAKTDKRVDQLEKRDQKIENQIDHLKQQTK